jgi:hypothetical protein
MFNRRSGVIGRVTDWNDAMLIRPIDNFLVVWFVLAAASTAYVAWDQYRNYLVLTSCQYFRRSAPIDRCLPDNYFTEAARIVPGSKYGSSSRRAAPTRSLLAPGRPLSGESPRRPCAPAWG